MDGIRNMISSIEGGKEGGLIDNVEKTEYKELRLTPSE